MQREFARIVLQCILRIRRLDTMTAFPRMGVNNARVRT